MARWIIATLAFLAIGWLDVAYGHRVAFVTLVALLLFVAVFGGHGPRPRKGDDDAGVPEPRAPAAQDMTQPRDADGAVPPGDPPGSAA